MKGIKAVELRTKTVDELKVLIEQERAALFVARRDLVFRKIKDTTGMNTHRRNIARMLGVIGEKQRGNAS